MSCTNACDKDQLCVHTLGASINACDGTAGQFIRAHNHVRPIVSDQESSMDQIMGRLRLDIILKLKELGDHFGEVNFKVDGQDPHRLRRRALVRRVGWNRTTQPQQAQQLRVTDSAMAARCPQRLDTRFVDPLDDSWCGYTDGIRHFFGRVVRLNGIGLVAHHSATSRESGRRSHQ